MRIVKLFMVVGVMLFMTSSAFAVSSLASVHHA